MPPKVRITKDSIIDAAIGIVRSYGVQGVNARTIASVLKCSTQPIFSNFETMEELHIAVVLRANELCDEYIKREIERGEFPPYKASGMAYIRFAKEEKELFKLLYMRDRTGETYSKEFEFGNLVENIVRDSTGLNDENMRLFHLEMWAYVHGIATMFVTGFVDIDWNLVSRMLTDAYQGMRKHYGIGD
ncbi:MAG: TetR/AcrR family transcriptional regulator [Clostridia bacterium]|nr:TetR/AcrR family transcriptional regulator [Clostridia bacterium]